MRHRSTLLILAIFVLATALTSVEKDPGYSKPPASMLPPVPFVSTPVTTTTSHNTTTTNMTTVAPTPHNTTTANMTTVVPTPHNTTTANMTTVVPTPHNTTTTNMTTVVPTPHNTTTTNITTTTLAPHNTTSDLTTPSTTKPPIPMPTPTTNITVGNYTAKNGNKLCVMVQAAIQVHVNSSKQHMVGTYVVPGNASSGGSCQVNKASLKITLTEGYITMDFTKNDTTNVVFLSTVAVNLSYAFKSGELSHLERKSELVQLFNMATSHSYSCKSESVSLGNDTYLEFRQERIQAFDFTNNQFGPLDLCKADQPDYRVAIGVGVVLLILIIIVIVAYVLSRNKRTAGYQTL